MNTFQLEIELLTFREKWLWNGTKETCGKRCYNIAAECRKAQLIKNEQLLVCAFCGLGRSYNILILDSHKQHWQDTVAQKPFLAMYVPRLPRNLPPHCADSYAADCHPSGTPHGEFLDFVHRLRLGVAAAARKDARLESLLTKDTTNKVVLPGITIGQEFGEAWRSLKHDKQTSNFKYSSFHYNTIFFSRTCL